MDIFAIVAMRWLENYMNKFLKSIDWKKFFYSFYWLLVILLLLDQVTKVIFLKLAASNGGVYEKVIIDNFFYLSYYRNTGAAWSMLESYPWVLAVVSFVASSAMLTYRIMKRKTLTATHKALWAAVIAGTIGNLIDRALYKTLTGEAGVVDFLHFQFGNYHFPVFNVADMCLVIGLISMIVLLLIEDFKPNKKQESVDTGTDHESK